MGRKRFKEKDKQAVKGAVAAIAAAAGASSTPKVMFDEGRGLSYDKDSDMFKIGVDAIDGIVGDGSPWKAKAIASGIASAYASDGGYISSADVIAFEAAAYDALRDLAAKQHATQREKAAPRKQTFSKGVERGVADAVSDASLYGIGKGYLGKPGSYIDVIRKNDGSMIARITADATTAKEAEEVFMKLVKGGRVSIEG